MQSPTSQADVRRLATFNAEIFGPDAECMTVRLLEKHPHLTWEDAVYFETHSGEIVSSLIYVPSKWRYGCVSLAVAEMTLVGTQPSYRRQGLVRRLNAYYEERMAHHGAHLSAIQGIPHFYRQFGYDYALPLEGGWNWYPQKVDSISASDLVFRPAVEDDCDAIAQLAESAGRELDICTHRTTQLWRYLLGNSDLQDAMGRETMIVQGDEGKTVAYFCLPYHHFGNALVVSEASNMSVDVGLSVLHWLAQQAHNAKAEGIRLNVADNCDLVQLARAYGATLQRHYAWQLLILSRGDFLQAVSAELNERLGKSCFFEMTRSVTLNFSSEAYSLEFQAGRLKTITEISPDGVEAEITMPVQAFLLLAMGVRTVTELRASYPDISARGENLLLLETLFPRLDSHIYTSY